MVALLQIHFDTLRWAVVDRKSIPLLLASLECLNCFFSLLLRFRITTLHLTETVKYNESSGLAGRNKNLLSFQKLKYLYSFHISGF